MIQYTSPDTPVQFISPREPIAREIRAIVWTFTYGQCWYCGDNLNPYENLCIDHVIPLAKGGTNEIENLVPCCSHCNSCKGTKTVEQWRVNFTEIPIDEEPWTHESGVFWFERDDKFFQKMRLQEIWYFRQSQERERWGSKS